MIKFSQNNEEEILLNLFKDQKISVLSIGENSGIHLSNVRALLLNGSYGTLVEPAPIAFKQLSGLYIDRKDVCLINAAISDYNGISSFFDSGEHLKTGDTSLLSSLNKNETLKWRSTTTFEEIKVEVITFQKMLELSSYKHFDFISIDAEGNDISILEQMNLLELKCKAICIEHNSNEQIFNQIKNFCERFGLTQMLLKNGENVVMAAPI